MNLRVPRRTTDYVRPDLAVPGTKLKVRMLRELWDAVVTEDSPFDPKNERIRKDG